MTNLLVKPMPAKSELKINLKKETEKKFVEVIFRKKSKHVSSIAEGKSLYQES